MENAFIKKTVIISGGLGDIGKAVVREFATEGLSISVGDIHPPGDAETFFKEIEDLNKSCKLLYTQVDVTEPESVRNWVDHTTSTLGVANIIIPNAAKVTLARILEVTPEQWSRELQVNLDGAFFLARYAASELLNRGLPGRIVFVGSWAAHSVHANLPTYSISKAGLRMLCKCMALELAPHNILVNEIAPGFVDAGLSKQVFEKDPSSMVSSQEKVPVKKIISVREVAKNIHWLSDFNNEHMTGSTLLMDGGLSLVSLNN